MYFIYAYEKGTTFPTPIFAKLANAEHCYMAITPDFTKIGQLTWNVWAEIF